ncbi:uncharacterized protein LOC125503173, partial [Dendroctonus ponderosae]|uniref:uncharacterized protein LOC125503173 n=1 Tax=Dendroctonus ponderosae TaxID=77166 RepID=UPI002035E075
MHYEMSEGKQNLPQEGTAGRRESLPTQVGCPTDSGGGNIPRKGAQAERRSSASVIDLKWDESKASSMKKTGQTLSQSQTPQRKRKLLDTSIHKGEDQIYKKRESPEYFTLVESLESITKLANDLEGYVEQNTKREIKEIARRLKRQVNVINQPYVTQWLNQFKYERIEKMTIDVDTQTSPKAEELKMKITQAEESSYKESLVGEVSVTETGQICPTCKRKYVESKDTQTQTDQQIYFDENRCNSLKDIDSYAKWLKIAPKNWADELFENTEIVSGNPLSTKVSTVKVVLVEPTDKQMERSIQLLYKNRYPELVETEESFAVLEHSSRWKLKQDTTACQKVIKIMQGEQESDLWDRFIQLREESREDEWVAIHHIERCSSE